MGRALSADCSAGLLIDTQKLTNDGVSYSTDGGEHLILAYYRLAPVCMRSIVYGNLLGKELGKKTVCIQNAFNQSYAR